MEKTVIKTKFEYADNGIVIRYGDLGNAPEVYEKEHFRDAIKEAYGDIVNNNIEIEAEELHGQKFIGFEVKIEIKPIFKTKALRDEFLRYFRPLIEKLKPLYCIKEGGEE